VIFKAVEPLRDTVIIGALAWFLVRLIQHGEKKFIEGEKPADPTTVDAIAKLLKVSVVITSILVVLQTLGFSISGVVAFGGIGGMAVGFAAKDLLANFFGGLTIYLDRPFTVGDWVRSPDRDIEGTVENIGWRLTCIRTFDKRPLYVPNAVFTTIAVENPSRMLNRRIKETIGIRYDDAGKMAPIVDKVKDMLTNHPEIDTNRTLIVNFNAFAPSSLDFFIYTFTKTTNWTFFHEVKQDVMLKIIDIIEEAGAECAFPTSTLHLADKDIFKGFDSKTLD
jgi:MscS family membrane protein